MFKKSTNTIVWVNGLVPYPTKRCCLGSKPSVSSVPSELPPGPRIAEHGEPVALDPLKAVYLESLIETPERFSATSLRQAALLCIDLQHLDAAPGIGMFRQHGAKEAKARAYYFGTLTKTVLPNVRRLQDAFRAQRLEVIHVRIQSLTRDGRDRSPAHKRLDLLAAPGSKEAAFLPHVAPQGDEIIINKTASGVFTSTNLAYVLRNLGITTLYITGVYTNECVSTTVRDAADLGYFVNLVSDGCTTVTKLLHKHSLAVLKDRYCRVLTADQALAELCHTVPIRA